MVFIMCFCYFVLEVFQLYIYSLYLYEIFEKLLNISKEPKDFF